MWGNGRSVWAQLGPPGRFSQRLSASRNRAAKPGVVGEDAPSDLSAGADDLGGDVDYSGGEGAELHGQQTAALRVVGVDPAGMDGQEQGGPGLEGPGQSGHGHVGPVGVEVVDRGVQRPDGFELGD